MCEWLTISGSIASIAGAWFSWKQAKKSKGFADGINAGKAEVKKQSESNDLAEFLSTTRATSSKLGSELIKNKKASEIKTDIEAYLTEFSSFIGKINRNSAGRLSSLKQSITDRNSELKDDSNLVDNVGKIKQFVDMVVEEISKLKNDALYQ